mgnify:CR=1 FL=1
MRLPPGVSGTIVEVRVFSPGGQCQQLAVLERLRTLPQAEGVRLAAAGRPGPEVGQDDTPEAEREITDGETQHFSRAQRRHADAAVARSVGTAIEFGRELSSETDLDAMLASVGDRLLHTLSIKHLAFFLADERDGVPGFRLKKAMAPVALDVMFAFTAPVARMDVREGGVTRSVSRVRRSFSPATASATTIGPREARALPAPPRPAENRMAET